MANRIDVKGWVAIAITAAVILASSILYLQTVDAAQNVTLGQHEIKITANEVKLHEHDGKFNELMEQRRLLEEIRDAVKER